MVKPDDSSLDPHDLKIIEGRAIQLLDRADAWEKFPVPVDDILGAAEVQVAPTSAFDPAAIVSYLSGKALQAGTQLKSAISKVFGLYDAGDNIIHIDDSVVGSKQTFLTLHETGHHDIPTHRKLFRFFQDCEKTLSPEIADQFEREANNFARFILFKGNAYSEYAADSQFGIKTPIKLAKKFGASLYASCREFARTNERACVVYALEPIKFFPGKGAQAAVRRIEPSPKFVQEFGIPRDEIVDENHFLWSALPIGRKITNPIAVVIFDKNGERHECLAEAFDTTYNILLLLYPVNSLRTIVSAVR